MNRERFEHLLSAYGADISRWPAEDREAAATFAAETDDAIARAQADERGLDTALDALVEPPRDFALLEARILKQAPKASRAGGFDTRALWALAACAMFGVLLGYGGGRLAPTQTVAESEDYFSMAFEAPFDLGEGG